MSSKDTHFVHFDDGSGKNEITFGPATEKEIKAVYRALKKFYDRAWIAEDVTKEVLAPKKGKKK